MRLIFNKSKVEGRRSKNEKGIALLIVLSTLMVLTASVVEFAYNSRINYRLAIHAKERLEAYYLAKSALNFSRLLLKYNKDAEKLLESAGSAGSSFGSEPLYRLMPLSSELLRGVLSGESSGLPGGSEGEEEGAEEEGQTGDEGEEEEEKATGEEDIESGVSMVSKEEAEKFLSFEGDFESEITEEQSKYDLNKIASLVSTAPAYDQRKQLLYSLLLSPSFANAFEDQEQDAATLVHAIADWVDSNGLVNEFENIQRGDEEGLYSDAGYKVKNGKLLNLSELRLVAGMTDDIYQLLAPFVTVYSADDKLNVCIGEQEDLIKALVHHYTNHAGCAQPVGYEDEEKMTELATAVSSACPDPDSMASALNSTLGLVDLEESSADSSDTSDSSSSSSTSTAGSKIAGCAFQFKDLLTKDNKIFRIRATGTVGETSVSISTVLNTGSSNPTQWKYLYFRVE
ncbi:MAG: general secretion pathway protein GspK [Deltaproteobacteria bacterium]|nr:general secretion pathway protein GspK [Deltaproteobacteria bacterium]